MLNFCFELKEVVLGLNESSAKKSSSYEGKVSEVNTCSFNSKRIAKTFEICLS